MNIERVLRKDRLQGKERRYTQKEVDEIVKGKDKTLQSQYAVCYYRPGRSLKSASCKSLS